MTYHRNSSKKQKGMSKVGKGRKKRKRTREGIKDKWGRGKGRERKSEKRECERKGKRFKWV